MAPNAHPNLQTARIICGALIFSALTFWMLCIGLTRGGSDPLNPDFPLDGTEVTAIGLGVGLAGLAAALFFASRARGASTASDGSNELTLKALSRLQTNLIVAWAMLEGASTILATLFLLTGVTLLAVIAAVVMLHGFATSFPRAAWFPSAISSR